MERDGPAIYCTTLEPAGDGTFGRAVSNAAGIGIASTRVFRNRRGPVKAAHNRRNHHGVRR